MRVRVFGSIEIEIGARRFGPRDLGGAKPKQLLEVLLAERGRTVPKERIAELLWGQALPRNVSATLETYVSVLRKRVGRLIATEPGAYRVATDLADVDLDRFDALVARGARPDLEAALALVRGEVMEDEPYGTWALRLRDEYRERHLQALVAAAEAALADGDYAAALAQAAAAVSRDAVREPAHRVVMLAAYALGRQDEALRAFDRCRTALAEELGVDPLPQTLALHTAILRHEHPGALLSFVAPQVARAAPARAPGEVPLLGRREEISRLERVARKAFAGSGTVVLIEGEAGIGKTRLLDELAVRLFAVPVLRAKCFELDRDLPFVPLAGALRELPGPLDGERYPALGEILPELEPSGLPPEVARGRALESLTAIVRDRAPLALLIDDLQWSDPSTLGALAYVQRRCVDVPVLVVVAFRSEEVPPEHAARRLPSAEHLELQPLTPADLSPLGVPDLYERTGGLPLFVTERLRAAAEGRADEIPRTLRELIIARCRSAGAGAHRLLAVASVLGRTFDPDVLASMIGRDAADLAEELEALCDLRLLRAGGDGFDFRHDLIREALADALSAPRRRLLHARALDALERAGADPADLVHHAEEAGAFERAVRYAIAAGDAARRRFANVEAAANYERAHRITCDHPSLLEPVARETLLIRLGRLLVTIGHVDDGERALHEARASAEERRDDRALFEALDALVFSRQRGASQPAQALAHAREALAVAQRTGDDLLLSRAHALVGSPSLSLGYLDESYEHSRLALRHAARAHATPPAYPMGRIALMLHHRAEEQQAIEWTRKAEDAAERQYDEETIIMVRWIRALSLSALGRVEEAIRALDSIAAVGRGEEVFWHARVPNTYGSMLADLYLYERALEHDLESFEAARSTPGAAMREVELQTRLNLAGDRLVLGRVTEARADVEAVRGSAGAVPYAAYRYLNRMHALDAEIALAEGDFERARAAAETCLAMAAGYGQPKNEIRGRLTLAGALAAAGDTAPARLEARSAARLADRLGIVGLSWRAWWAAHRFGGTPTDLRLAQAAVLRAAEGAGESLRDKFLAAVPVER